MPSSSNGWTEVPSTTAGSVFDLDKVEVIDAMRAQRARTLALLRDIPEPDWERIVVPRWRLREVAAHLVSTDEAALTGRLLTVGLGKTDDAGVSRIEAWNDRQVGRWADRPIPEIMRGLEKWARRMERLSGVLPGRISGRALPTPFGKVSLLWMGSMRVYDEWIHLEDVRRVYNLPSDNAESSVRPVARQLLAGLPVQSPPHIKAGTGRVSYGFDDVDLPRLGFDLGTRRFGFGIEGEDARLTGSAGALTMVAARRDAWRDAEQAGRLKVEGDRQAAETLLEGLLLV